MPNFNSVFGCAVGLDEKTLFKAVLSAYYHSA